MFLSQGQKAMVQCDACLVIDWLEWSKLLFEFEIADFYFITETLKHN
jgi:hypothetical protein